MVNIKLINQLIEQSNVPKTRVCELCKIHRPTFERMMETGDCRVSLLDSLARFFRIPAWALLDGSPSDLSIITSGPYSPGVMTGSVIHAAALDTEILRKENESLKRELALATELLATYRKISDGVK